MVIKNALVLTENFEFQKQDIEFNEKIINVGNTEKTDAECADFSDCYLVPGFVDIHTHGAIGMDAMDENVDFAKWKSYMLSNGITTFFPTTVAATDDEIKNALSRLCLSDGINLEGPFLSIKKKGAHDENKIKAVDTSLLSQIKDKVKITTVAPEMWDNLEKIEEIVKMGIRVSLGHSEADFELSKKAIEKGAKHITHLFNAMSPLSHREPGLVSAAFEDDEVFCEVISDGVHLHPAIVKLIYKQIGPDRMVLISDAMAATGLPDGSKCKLGGLDVFVKDGKATLSDGTIAGSASSLYRDIRMAVSFGIPLEDVIKMATLTPARAVGLDDKIGSIKVGKDADFVLLSKDLEILDVYYKGVEHNISK